MKPSVVLDEEKVAAATRKINDCRDTHDDWQSLLKAIISQIQDDFIRLQHPSRRNQVYLKEAFCSAIAALWDADFKFAELKGEDGDDLSFREILAARFGIENLDKEEIHKIDLGPLQEGCIKEAKEYWLDKTLQIVTVPDFLIFDGRAFSVWRTDEESHIDYNEMILHVEDSKDEKEFGESFLKLVIEIISYYRDIKIKSDTIELMANGLWEVLRMNACFR